MLSRAWYGGYRHIPTAFEWDLTMAPSEGPAFGRTRDEDIGEGERKRIVIPIPAFPPGVRGREQDDSNFPSFGRPCAPESLGHLSRFTFPLPRTTKRGSLTAIASSAGGLISPLSKAKHVCARAPARASPVRSGLDCHIRGKKASRPSIWVLTCNRPGGSSPVADPTALCRPGSVCLSKNGEGHIAIIII